MSTRRGGYEPVSSEVEAERDGGVDVESGGGLTERLLETAIYPVYHLYHVGSEVLLRKIFQISPWKLNTMSEHRRAIFHGERVGKGSSGGKSVTF